MKPSDVLQQNRALILEIVSQHRVANPRVFGSVVKGTDTEGSDLDILVDPIEKTTLFDLGGLQVDLEEALNIKVDLLTPNELPQAFRARVLREARPL